MTKGTNYDMFDRLNPKEGKKDINYEDFALAMRDALKSKKWPRRQDNIPDW